MAGLYLCELFPSIHYQEQRRHRGFFKNDFCFIRPFASAKKDFILSCGALVQPDNDV